MCDHYPKNLARSCTASSLPIVRLGLAAVAWLGLSLAVEATPRDVYTGNLGTAAVVFEISTPAGRLPREGRYFYVEHGVDIPLRGHLDSLAEGLPLRDLPQYSTGPVFDDPATGRPRIVWQGRLDGGQYSGTWRDSAAGRALPFTLRQVATYDPGALTPDAVEAVTRAIVQGAHSGLSWDVDITLEAVPFDFLRLDVSMQRGPEVATGDGVAYRMLTDRRTQVSYPRLARHPDKRSVRDTNRLLEQRHWALNLEALACAATAYTDSGSAAGTLGNFDDELVTVAYLSVTLMSVVESGSTYCGGAHPNNHFEPYTIDLIEGGYFDFARILAGYTDGRYKPEYSATFMAFVHGELRRQVVDDAERGCSDFWPDYLYLHFTAPEELAFNVSGIGHALGVCLGTPLTVPFSRLKPILKPDAARYLPSYRDPGLTPD